MQNTNSRQERLHASLEFTTTTANDRPDTHSQCSRSRNSMLPEDCAKDHPCRHGRVLCFGRAARCSSTARQARDRRLAGQALCRLRRFVRGQEFRSALGHAGSACGTVMSRCDLRTSGVHTLSGSLAKCAGDLQASYRSDRTTVARRGVPRRYREQGRITDGHSGGKHHPRANPPGIESDCLCRRSAKQVLSKTGL